MDGRFRGSEAEIAAASVALNSVSIESLGAASSEVDVFSSSMGNVEISREDLWF